MQSAKPTIGAASLSPAASATCAEDAWLLDAADDAVETEASGAPAQFDLVCDNVRLDVSSRRSPLADLGRMLQAVLGLAVAATHRSKDQVL